MRDAEARASGVGASDDGTTGERTDHDWSKHWDQAPGWEERAAQAFRDDWAIRILHCPLHSCSRKRRCAAGGLACPGMKTHPIPRHISDDQVVLLRMHLSARLAAINAGPDSPEAANYARQIAREQETDRRGWRLAWKRAKAGEGNPFLPSGEGVREADG